MNTCEYCVRRVQENGARDADSGAASGHPISGALLLAGREPHRHHLSVRHDCHLVARGALCYALHRSHIVAHIPSSTPSHALSSILAAHTASFKYSSKSLTTDLLYKLDYYCTVYAFDKYLCL